jgi:hypothetical protein
MANPEPSLTPAQAIHALTQLEGYEEGLTARIGGLTSMVFGIAVAGIFVTYGVASAWGFVQRHPWVQSFLWVPWILAGTVITTSLWSLHAIQLRRPDRGWRASAYSLMLSLVFTAIALALSFLPVPQIHAGAAFAPLASQLGMFGFMTVVTGLFTLVMAGMAYGRFMGKPRGAAVPLLGAGLAILVGGFAMGMVALDGLPAALLSAGLCGTAYFGAGLVPYLRG